MCPACGGTGRVHTESIRDRARKGGNAAYLQSLLPNHISMSQRGKLGGRPKNPNLSQIIAARRAPGSRESKGMAPESTAAPGTPRIPVTPDAQWLWDGRAKQTVATEGEGQPPEP